MCNSHIRHSRAGHALLRWRKECGRLWVQLASAVQAPIHSVAYMYIDSYQFLPVTSSVIVTCTYPFTADDNQFQKSTILSSAMSLYRSSGHDINPSFTNFVRKIDQEIKWNFCVVRLLYLVFAHNLIIHFYIIWRVILPRLSGCCSIYNEDQSIHFTDKPSRVVEIIGMRNDANHEPIPGHQLNFLWQNAVSDLYRFDHQRVNISLGSMLGRFHTTIKGGSMWDLKLCEMRVLDI